MNQRQREADAWFLAAVECMRKVEEERPQDQGEVIVLLLGARHALKQSRRLRRLAKRRARLRAILAAVRRTIFRRRG